MAHFQNQIYFKTNESTYSKNKIHFFHLHCFLIKDLFVLEWACFHTC